ncbi:DUF4393 domain-containing protein [Xylanibacter ruminicola]|uniref:DUF4393 domain-containing protein n=1 Tax=Xylanibacter ruminicola TaxID=839 RepID=A0A1M6R218_XYLRU|nr:DUF4393 domain-containing protein [Xylanibacter ruminicola]SHK26440.1 protein of unknown function [Xylanibacter ruminicola]
MDLMKDLGVEVYKDAARPAVSEVGAVAGRTVKALLAPIRGFLWCWEKIEDYVEKEVQKRLEKVPEERLKSPDPEIAVPLLQSLTYTAQNETLREMYIALLANSMDKGKENIVHPSYVEIIKKMNRLDALLFEKLSEESGYRMIVNPRISISGTNKFIAGVLPEWYLGWTIEEYDEFSISASLVRLSKFGIIDLMYDRSINGADYQGLWHTPFTEKMLEAQKFLRPYDSLEITATNSVVFVNDYGKQFRQACR